LRLCFKIIFLCICFGSLNAQDFDPTNVNYNLLNELVLAKINAKRESKGIKVLESNLKLNDASVYYTKKYSYKKFHHTSENKLLIKKKVKLICKQKGFNPHLINFHINNIQAIKYSSKSYYYDVSDSASPLHLFYGDRKPNLAKNPDFVSEPIKLYSYDELADKIVDKMFHDEARNKAINKGYEFVGVSTVVDPKTVGGRKIPQLKVILIFGGRIINWIETNE